MNENQNYRGKPDPESFLKKTEGGSLLLLGSPEYFTEKEIGRFLKRYGLVLAREAGEGRVVAVLEGRRMSPAEEMISERLYGEGIPHYRIGELERLMSEKLGERELLMSLKLGYDTERLLRLIENEHLTDDLFLKLLKLWRWEADELMEEESDARILTALLRRFLNAGDYESDIYHSPVSLLRLIRETDRPELLEALTGWPDFLFRQQRGRSLEFHEALASHPGLNEKSIERLRRRSDRKIDRALAGNPAISERLIDDYLGHHDPELDRALASNPSLTTKHFKILIGRGEETAEILLLRQRIDQERLETAVESFGWRELPPTLAENPRIEAGVFEELFAKADEEMRHRLATNPALPEGLAESLAESGDPGMTAALAANPSVNGRILRKIFEEVGEWEEEQRLKIEQALAANPSTPVEILKDFYEAEREELLEELAANPSTPMEILHQLKLDFRLFPIVSHNPAFVERANFEMGMR